MLAHVIRHVCAGVLPKRTTWSPRPHWEGGGSSHETSRVSTFFSPMANSNKLQPTDIQSPPLLNVLSKIVDLTNLKPY